MKYLTLDEGTVPQLSKSIEHEFEDLQFWSDDSDDFRLTENNIKQHILALQQENERLKESNDRQEYQLAVAWEQITDYENLINAIKQIIRGKK